MKFTARERTSLRAMVEFARRHGQGLTPLSEVARAQELPLPYLERIVASLRQAGLLESVRGAHGGYCLTRPPAHISIGDVFRAVEGTLMTLDCVRDDGGECARESICVTRNVWEIVSNRLSETLDHITLADVVDASCEEAIVTDSDRAETRGAA
ncbi:MAG TPA: Rrf2 family transcriptional regulator [Chloroflexi bacterium]|jgi:Rrf2 family cysteine metabolism transcriptional repressor|nr:Rrf2 family transcriptional regulator [Chloroflexota bacterium]